jgi:hypothetical protein
MLFEQRGAARGRFRAVPERYLADPDHSLGEGAWESLQIPVGTAFFFRNAALDRFVALYPSPAGATESDLDPDTWQAVLGESPLAKELRPDVEALLLRRADGHCECFLVPIDVCYELVGRMRLHWQGFDGGAEARADLADFFARVRARAGLGSGRDVAPDAPRRGPAGGARGTPQAGPGTAAAGPRDVPAGVAAKGQRP